MADSPAFKWLKPAGTAFAILVSLVLCYFAAIPPVIYLLFRVEIFDPRKPGPVVESICEPAGALYDNWQSYEGYVEWWAETIGMNY